MAYIAAFFGNTKCLNLPGCDRIRDEASVFAQKRAFDTPIAPLNIEYYIQVCTYTRCVNNKDIPIAIVLSEGKG